MATKLFQFRISVVLKDAYDRAVHDGKLNATEVCEELRNLLARRVSGVYDGKTVPNSTPPSPPPEPAAVVGTPISMDDIVSGD